MYERRPKGMLGVGWACLESAAQGRLEHRPLAEDYPESVVRRVRFTAGGGLGWRLSALKTPRSAPTPWKVVVVTGAPSWAEYWAPVMAALPPDRSMIVVDRPGFAASEPVTCVPDLRLQAEALSPVLQTAPGQRLLVVGQSYGAAIAALLAARRPPRLGGLLLLSTYLGELGPTGRWLVAMGSKATTVMPRDLKNAVTEVACVRNQLAIMGEVLPRLTAPIHLVHGEADDFAPVEAVRRLRSGLSGVRFQRFETVAGAGHFLNDGPPDDILRILESCTLDEVAPASPRSIASTWKGWTSRQRAGVNAAAIGARAAPA